MGLPKVSVIVPVYNGADYLGEAIQSVLDQTYHNFELVIVSDASPDNSRDVVARFDDPRLIYLEHETNQGADIARNNGIRASSGSIIAFLDQDDIFHPAKLETHVNYLRENPEIGFTYNDRFAFYGTPNSIHGISRPPPNITLAEVVLSTHLLSPTDMVVRREWAFHVGLWYEAKPIIGTEIILLGRLSMAGCLFANVGRVLNYRRYYSQRVFSNLVGLCQEELECRDKIFRDPRCPEEVVRLRNISFSNNYLAFAYVAFAQDETVQGQEFIRQAVRLNPSLLDGKPCGVVELFIANSIADESQDHEELLQRLFAQLPPEFVYLSEQYEWAAGRTYLLKGGKSIIWNRLDQGQTYLTRATALGAEIDEPFLAFLTAQLLDYEAAFGVDATKSVLQNLSIGLQAIDSRTAVQRLKGDYSVNQAFQNYRDENYVKVPSLVWRAITNNPSYLIDRGVMAILLRSIGYTLLPNKPKLV